MEWEVTSGIGRGRKVRWRASAVTACRASVPTRFHLHRMQAGPNTMRWPVASGGTRPRRSTRGRRRPEAVHASYASVRENATHQAKEGRGPRPV